MKKNLFHSLEGESSCQLINNFSLPHFRLNFLCCMILPFPWRLLHPKAAPHLCFSLHFRRDSSEEPVILAVRGQMGSFPAQKKNFAGDPCKTPIRSLQYTRGKALFNPVFPMASGPTPAILNRKCGQIAFAARTRFLGLKHATTRHVLSKRDWKTWYLTPRPPIRELSSEEIKISRAAGVHISTNGLSWF